MTPAALETLLTEYTRLWNPTKHPSVAAVVAEIRRLRAENEALCKALTAMEALACRPK